MSQPFNPQEHLIKLPKRVKDPETGQWVIRHDDYLEVKWRLCWFRDRYPHGIIETEELCVDLDRGYARYKARVTDGEGGSATGHGTETKADFADYCERAETRALGRALAALGIGTQFVGAELSEGEHICDAPVVPHGTAGMSHPLPVGEEGTPGAATLPATNGHTPAPEPPQPTGAHPTSEQIEGLFALALETCGEDPDILSTRIRQVMNVPANASTSKRLLPKTMSGEQFDRLWTYYQTLLGQLQRQTEVMSRGTPSSPQPGTQPAQPPSEVPAAVPPPASADASSSAGSNPPDATERERIVREAMDAGIPEKEARHIVTHHSLKSAHSLLLAAAKKRPRAA
jgi:hypothetical protein